jgi:TetR/AcrR family transcriptional regulator, acrAB operon repressor
MVRRTKLEAAGTRAALLDAAQRVFRERGVAHTSLAEIAAAAGVTRGAVYWHFRDKSALFEALCERVQLPMEAMLASAGEIRQPDPLGALRGLAVNGLVRLATDARTQAVFDVIFHKCEFAADIGSIAGRRHATDSGCLANVERLLKQAVSAGQLPRDTDTRLAARCLNAFMVGVMHEWVQSPKSYNLAAAAPAMVDSLLAGLVARPPRLIPAKPALRPRSARRSARTRDARA